VPELRSGVGYAERRVRSISRATSASSVARPAADRDAAAPRREQARGFEQHAERRHHERRVLPGVVGDREGVARFSPQHEVMFATVETRRDLVRALWRDVPFLRELDEIQALRKTLLALARRGHGFATGPLVARSPDAMTYLLTVMTGHAIVESVVARPSHLPLNEVEECFQRIVATLLFPAPAHPRETVPRG
jgi:hypothetical protein